MSKFQLEQFQNFYAVLKKIVKVTIIAMGAVHVVINRNNFCKGNFFIKSPVTNWINDFNIHKLISPQTFQWFTS